MHVGEPNDLPVEVLRTTLLDPINNSHNASSVSIQNTDISSASPQSISLVSNQASNETNQVPIQTSAPSVISKEQPTSTELPVINSVTPITTTQRPINVASIETRNANQPTVSQSQSTSQLGSATSTVSNNIPRTSGTSSEIIQPSAEINSNRNQNNASELYISQEKPASQEPVQTHSFISANPTPTTAPHSIHSNLAFQQVSQAQSLSTSTQLNQTSSTQVRPLLSAIPTPTVPLQPSQSSLSSQQINQAQGPSTNPQLNQTNATHIQPLLNANSIPTASAHSTHDNLAPQNIGQAQAQNTLNSAPSTGAQLNQNAQLSTVNNEAIQLNGSTAHVDNSTPIISGVSDSEASPQLQNAPLQNVITSQPTPQQHLLTTDFLYSIPLPDFAKWNIPFNFDVLYDLAICYDFIRSYKSILFNDLVSQLSESFWFFCFTFLSPDIHTLQIHILSYILKCLYDRNPQVKPIFPLEQVSISNFNLFLWHTVQSFEIPLPSESNTFSKDLNIYSTTRRYRISLTKNIINTLVKSSKLDMQNLYVTPQDFKTVKRLTSDKSILTDFTWAVMIQTPEPSQQAYNNGSNVTSIQSSTDTSPTALSSAPQEQDTGNNSPIINIEKLTLSSIKPILQKLMIFKPLDKLLDIGLLPLVKEFQIIHLGIDRARRSYYYFASIGGILVKANSNKQYTWEFIDNIQKFNQLLNSLHPRNYHEAKLCSRLSRLSGIITDKFLQKIKSSVELLNIPYDEAIEKLIQSNEIPSYAKMIASSDTEILDMLILTDSTSISFSTFKESWLVKIQVSKIEHSMRQIVELLEIPSESEIFKILSHLQSPSSDLSIERTCQEFLAKIQLYIDQSFASSHSKTEQYQFLKNFAYTSKYFIRASILFYNHLTESLKDEKLLSNIRSTNEFNEAYINSALELIKNCLKKEFKGDENFRVISLLHKDKSCPSIQPHKQKCHFHYDIIDTVKFAKIKLPDTSKIPRRKTLPEKRNTYGRSASGRGRINYKEPIISDSDSSTETRSTKTTGSKKSNNSKKNVTSVKKQVKLDPFITRRKLVLSSSSDNDLNGQDEEDHIIPSDSDIDSLPNSHKSKSSNNKKKVVVSEDSDNELDINNMSDDSNINENNNSKSRKRGVISSDDDLDSDDEPPVKIRSQSPFEDDESSSHNSSNLDEEL